MAASSNPFDDPPQPNPPPNHHHHHHPRSRSRESREPKRLHHNSSLYSLNTLDLTLSNMNHPPSSSNHQLISINNTPSTTDHHTLSNSPPFKPHQQQQQQLALCDPFLISNESSRSSSPSPTIDTSPILFASSSITGPSPTSSAVTELAFLQALLDPALNRHDVHLMVATRVQRLIRDDDAGRMRKLSPMSLASRRVPAILFTVILELGVGAVVGTYAPLLQRHVILVSFMPMISAICGNIGLQASTSTLRALATGYASHTVWSSILQVLAREFIAALFIGSILFVGLGLLIMFWASSFNTGLVCGLSIIISASAAGIMGTLAPIGFKVIGLDPALCAGPLETAVQDLIGITTYLQIAQWLLP